MPKSRARAAARHWMMQRRKKKEPTIIVIYVSLQDELENFLSDELDELLVDAEYLTIEEYIEYLKEGGID